ITGCGFVFPSSTTLAMNAGRKAIGASSAIVGASGFIAGGIVSPLTGAGDMLLTSAFIMLVCSALSWGLSRRL
ncbi:MAG: Bcr/CflA family drug resistance efflux transporter, partial [Muribaculaceae bacterium]|nr:Bcr/CflA family drug resistance efflux transporter [Muribaculaceae bacterium]